MATQLDLADAQLTGFAHSRFNRNDIIGLVTSMGLTKREWIKLKKDNAVALNDVDTKEVNEHFNIYNEPNPITI